MDLQAFIDGFNRGTQKARAESKQMTLREMINRLEELSDNTQVECLEKPHSYRGYYADLCLERGEGTMRARLLADRLTSCLGKSYTGYKGGEFVMNEDTPVWIGKWGAYGGQKIIGIDADGHFQTMSDSYE